MVLSLDCHHENVENYFQKYIDTEVFLLLLASFTGYAEKPASKLPFLETNTKLEQVNIFHKH